MAGSSSWHLAPRRRLCGAGRRRLGRFVAGNSTGSTPGKAAALANGRDVSTEASVQEREGQKSTPYEFFILAVSVHSIINLVLAFVVPFESQSWWLIMYVDSLLTI